MATLAHRQVDRDSADSPEWLLDVRRRPRLASRLTGSRPTADTPGGRLGRETPRGRRPAALTPDRGDTGVSRVQHAGMSSCDAAPDRLDSSLVRQYESIRKCLFLITMTLVWCEFTADMSVRRRY